ncbi:Proline--tRNA ligase [Actinidia chinensis var. chinensis]|uniref:Proline--tRNA ligase n=1 Tax=Actinidia chinensis var. chinensis TaxID=1590841 RepID=A0A2R6QF26_ACTCC|nr:Proline--tRNA ligase [Actinidia chinensis var. chinensis]
MADESNPQTSLSEGSPQGKLPEVDVPSSPATELNTMTQGDLDRLRETCSFPMGVQTRIHGKGETILFASMGEVAFYEAVFPVGLRFPVYPTIKRILNFYGICPTQLSPNAWRNIISVLVIWHFHRCYLSLNEFRCLYTLLKGPGSESGWLYFKARPSKNILKGAPSNVKGWKRRFFFVSGDDWEFHPIIPRKQCNKVPVLSPIEEERFRQVFEKIGGGHFKIPVILTSRTFYKYFSPGRVEVSSSGSGVAEGDIGGEAEGDIREAAALASHASESSYSTGVSRPDVPSREGSVEFVGTIRDGMRIPLHASNLGLLRRFGERNRDHLGLIPSSLSSSSGSSELAKVAAQKIATPSSKGVVISEGSEMASKKRAPDNGSKGKEVAPLPEAKKIKIGSDAHAALMRPSVVPGEGTSARRTLGEALGPQASVMASAATTEKILVGVILLADKEKVEKLTFDQVVTKFLHVLGQEVILGSSLAVRNRDFTEGALNQRALAKSSKMEMVRAQNRVIELEEALAEEKNKGEESCRGNRGEERGGGEVEGASRQAGKRQLAHQYPNLGIDLEDVEMDQDFLAQEEIEAKKRATEDEGASEAGTEGKED